MIRWLGQKFGPITNWLLNLSNARRLFLIFGLALLFRMIILLSISTDPARSMLIDSTGYLLPAQNMVLHGRFSSDMTAPYSPEIIRTPGYPTFLALCILVFGSLQPYLGIVLAQTILGAATSVGLLYLGEKLFGPKIGIAAGLLHAIAPIQVLMVGWILTETVFTTLFIAGLLLLATGLQRRTYWLFLAGGIVLGAASLVRPIGTWMMAPLVLAIVLEKTLTHKVRSAVLLLIGYLLIIGPWMGRNYYYFRRFEITSVVDYHLYYFALPDFLARQEGIPLDEAEALLDARLANVPDVGDPWPVARESVVVQEVLNEHLIGFLWVNGVESLMGLIRPGFSFMQITLFTRDSHEVEATLGLSWNSLPDILDAISRQNGLVLVIEAYMFVFMWSMLILSVVGVITLIVKHRWAVAAMLGLLPALMMYPPGLGANARYRSVVEPLMILLMTVGIAWLLSRLKWNFGLEPQETAETAPRSTAPPRARDVR